MEEGNKLEIINITKSLVNGFVKSKFEIFCRGCQLHEFSAFVNLTPSSGIICATISSIFFIAPFFTLVCSSIFSFINLF